MQSYVTGADDHEGENRETHVYKTYERTCDCRRGRFECITWNQTCFWRIATQVYCSPLTKKRYWDSVVGWTRDWELNHHLATIGPRQDTFYWASWYLYIFSRNACVCANATVYLVSLCFFLGYPSKFDTLISKWERISVYKNNPELMQLSTRNSL